MEDNLIITPSVEGRTVTVEDPGKYTIDVFSSMSLPLDLSETALKDFNKKTIFDLDWIVRRRSVKNIELTYDYWIKISPAKKIELVLFSDEKEAEGKLVNLLETCFVPKILSQQEEFLKQYSTLATTCFLQAIDGKIKELEMLRATVIRDFC